MTKAEPNKHVANMAVERLLRDLTGLDVAELAHADYVIQLVQKMESVAHDLKVAHREVLVSHRKSEDLSQVHTASPV